MSLLCPKDACRAKPGMCLHEKVLGVVLLAVAALLLLRRPL